MFTFWIFNEIILCVYIFVKKCPLYVNFSIPTCGKWFFSQYFTPLVHIRFWRHVPYLETRIWRCLIFHTYFNKWFFWPSKLCCPLKEQRKKTFLASLNVMILQTLRNECVRFGVYVNIEVSYKILWLEVQKKNPKFAQSTLFWIGANLRQFWWKTLLKL